MAYTAGQFVTRHNIIKIEVIISRSSPLAHLDDDGDDDRDDSSISSMKGKRGNGKDLNPAFRSGN